MATGFVAPKIRAIGNGDSTVRVAAGSGWSQVSPVPGSSPLVLADVDIRPGSPVPVEVEHSEVAVISVGGGLTVDDEDVPAGQLVVLRPGVAALLGGEARAMVLGGEPVGARHIWWNFVHSDPDRIEQAKDEWVAQQFPRVPDDHDPWVPLPGGGPVVGGGGARGGT